MVHIDQANSHIYIPHTEQFQIYKDLISHSDKLSIEDQIIMHIIVKAGFILSIVLS